MRKWGFLMMTMVVSAVFLASPALAAPSQALDFGNRPIYIVVGSDTSPGWDMRYLSVRDPLVGPLLRSFVQAHNGRCGYASWNNSMDIVRFYVKRTDMRQDRMGSWGYNAPIPYVDREKAKVKVVLEWTTPEGFFREPSRIGQGTARATDRIRLILSLGGSWYNQYGGYLERQQSNPDKIEFKAFAAALSSLDRAPRTLGQFGKSRSDRTDNHKDSGIATAPDIF